MIEATLHVDPRTIRFRQERPATGDIWLRAGATEFPVHGWNDFVVVIVGAFATAARQMLEGAGRARVDFMDGPHAVDLIDATGGSWYLRLFDTGTREIVRHEVRVPAAPLVASVLAAADAILSAHRHAGCWSADAQALADEVANLRRRSGGAA